MSKKPRRPEVISTRLSTVFLRELEEIAAAEDRTISSLVSQAVREFLGRSEGRAPADVSTPTKTLQRIQRGQRMENLERTAQDLLAAIQALREDESS